MITCSYDPAIVYGWLNVGERLGLDKQASLDRFEGKVRKELMRWAHVDGVRFERKHSGELVLTPPDDVFDVMTGQIQMLMIDCHFLVYDSPKQHIQALRETEFINLRVSLSQDIAEAYHLTTDQADRICRAQPSLETMVRLSA